MYSEYSNIMPKIISLYIYFYFELYQTTATATTSYSTPKLIKAVGHSAEPQTAFYGKKNFKSIAAQWMGRLEL
jgi:hypothetical protein